jgi:hypothetical protein
MPRASLSIGSMLVLLAAPLYAQKSNTSGFMAGIRLSSVSVTAPVDEDTQHEAEAGGGLGARLGWGVSPNFTLFAGLDLAKMEFKRQGASGNYTAVHLDLGVQYRFASATKKVIPYLEAGFTGLATGAIIRNPGEPEREFVHGGSGGTLGVGVNYYITGASAVDLSIGFTAAKFENATIGEVAETGTAGDAGSVRVSVGFTFFPMKK